MEFLRWLLNDLSVAYAVCIIQVGVKRYLLMGFLGPVSAEHDCAAMSLLRESSTPKTLLRYFPTTATDFLGV